MRHQSYSAGSDLAKAKAGCLLAMIFLAICPGRLVYSDPASLIQKAAEKETGVITHASGTFEVKLISQDDQSVETGLGRMLIDKKFHGDLEAISKGQMLSAKTSVKGSAGYVAIEKVSGSLQGRKGTFVLQHSGTMTRGEPQLSITVVPDSATEQLTGLTGRMRIKIADGKHSYDFEFRLPEKP
jgi:hypothetical protein